MTRGRPWVTIKLGASLDGRTALKNGVSRWITSAEARRDVHAMRARSCAVMTGIGTVIVDDPELTGVAAVLFDEFHERSLDADMGLALARDVQSGLRELRPQLPAAAALRVGGARTALYQWPPAGVSAVQHLSGLQPLVAQWRHAH